VSLQVKEIHALNEEIGRVTTLQYRAPELCDLYQKLGIDEKVDIWALGVVLYKLCYFTTPFEESGQVIRWKNVGYPVRVPISQKTPPLSLYPFLAGNH
jgi:serine/threonine protein kinase